MSQLKQQESNVPLLDAINTAQYNTFVEKGIRNTKPKQPMRTTKISQKLKLFPEDSEHQWVDHDEPMDVYTQLAKIPHGMAREEAEMLNKMDRSQLSRMTAYCTASLYTPFALTYPVSPPHHHEDASKNTRLPEIFLFDYGVVVFWGMSFKDEQRVLKLLEPFEEEKLEPDDIETEEFHYYYNESYQPRIYNDIITLRNPTNYLVKLTIAHAIAQSVKMTLFERLIDDTINETKYIPQVMAESGNIQLSRTAITKKIGQLFIMRINVNLVSNILDTPEIFWSEPTLEPLYTAMRGYLEISQRVELLNQRVEVISDLLEMLKDHLNSSHGEQLEWIVIWLIGMEIVVAVITTCLDAFSLSHK
ncbi:hypothetical protein RO3G_02151 [Rhizopus delemar RA 99-880]|uniref:DUF155 domain-containing protein n=1 Tax=Rhizopus delemar (strain RA 99-880 / ATCC MYA-4621 / FGSC 9543 / NRRL 43880) TaxID=246409 RepID=I1BML7_RHIO9|nr:hypothetical protein RO3G_02151 [Rhizopus delemar RA 99-880]|eukprot:EIE77447.1 hypothetical protein RO3G_02151 [Rhizopus delemar RA 99-880]